MTSVFRRVALIGKYQPQDARSHDPVIDEIGDFLIKQGCEVVLEHSNAGMNEGAEPTRANRHPVMTVEEIGQQCDLGLVVGGDGTMLGIGRQLAPYGVPLIGINRGRLGFITDIALEDYAETLRPMLAGEYDEDHRSLIQARVMRGDDKVFEALAMNDVVVNRGATSGMVELRVSVGRAFVATHRADGLIIATSTGSTAYALSAGGPLLHPAIPGWVMVPIAPHSLSNRPILLPDAEEVTIEVVNDRDASANFDMQSLASVQQGDRIVVKRSDYHVRFLHPRGWSYFDTLRRKMHWNTKGES